MGQNQTCVPNAAQTLLLSILYCTVLYFTAVPYFGRALSRAAVYYAMLTWSYIARGFKELRGVSYIARVAIVGCGACLLTMEIPHHMSVNACMDVCMVCNRGMDMLPMHGNYLPCDNSISDA